MKIFRHLCKNNYFCRKIKELEVRESKSSPFYIVVGRQFGSGGLEFARELASRLGVECYDKTLVTEAAQRFGFSREIIARADERCPSRLRSFLSCNPGIPAAPGIDSVGKETMYSIQSAVIRQLAAEGSAIFVGRTADYILRDAPLLLSVFLHSTPEKRAERIVRRNDAKNIREARDLLCRKDKERQQYYKYYTGRIWGAADNYHLCLDASAFPVDVMADTVIALLNRMRQNVVKK